MSSFVIYRHFASSGGVKASTSTLIRSTAALALCAGGLVAGFTVATPRPAAAASTLYAYPWGTGTPSGCPQSSIPADQCSLTEALTLVGPGGTIILAVSGAEKPSSEYWGNFTIATAGTSSAAPVTMEPETGAGNAILNGNGGSSTGCPTTACDGPVLTVASGVYAAIFGVTIVDAANTATNLGGGIYNDGTLTVTSSTISADWAGHDGGGIDNADQDGSGTLTVTDSTFSSDFAPDGGGAIDNADNGGRGTITITSSSFVDDQSEHDGGAIDNGNSYGNGTVTVTTSTFVDDSATQDGGAIDSGDYYGSGTTTVTTSTFDDDSSEDAGGAIASASFNGHGTLTVTSSTFSQDHAGSGGAISNGDYFGSGSAASAADILSGATSGGECYGTITDDGYNVDDDGSCGLHGTGSASDSPAIDGYLGLLGHHGGPTETVPLLAVSTSSTPEGPDPAFAVIPGTVTVPGSNTGICSLPDQRGVAREVPCDMGAFELVLPLYAYPAGTGATAGCPQSTTPPDECSLTTALAEVRPGYTVILGESGVEGESSTYYVGNFTLSTVGTSSAAPVTIRAVTGAGNAILDGNNGKSRGCSTGSCDAPVLTVLSGVHAIISRVTIQDARNTLTIHGGGIDNEGVLNVTRSTFSDDAATVNGGAISNGVLYGSGTVTVTDSTFSHDSGEYGGAIANGDNGGTGVLTVTTSTFSDDSASSDGGAIDNGDASGTGTLTVASSTFTGDSANDGGGIDNPSGTVSLAADVLAGAASGGECHGTMIDQGYNVDDDGTCGFHAAGSVSDSPAIAGYVGTLGSYGGPTETVPLLAVSTSSTAKGSDPAFGVIPRTATVPGSSTAICSLADQRGVVRDKPCDMGAFELLATTTVITSTTSKPVVGQQITVSVTVTPVPPGVGKATGTVAVSDGTYRWTCTLTAASVGRTSCKIAERVSGAFPLTASYSGDANFASSKTATSTEITVNKASTTTSITSTTSKPVAGEPITVSVTVKPVAPGGGDPTGRVTVSDGKQTCTFTLTLSSSGKGSCKITEKEAGKYSLTASYSGDKNFTSSKTSTATVVIVGKA